MDISMGPNNPASVELFYLLHCYIWAWKEVLGVLHRFCASVRSSKWSNRCSPSQLSLIDMVGEKSSSNTPFALRKSWGLMFKQLRFTITHTEFLLCWHIWNYCTGSEPPKMTEDRKIRGGSVKGDTLVTRLPRPVLAFERAECQQHSPSVVTLNKSINSHSPHIKSRKSIWHLARTLYWNVCGCVAWMHTYIFLLCV